jgi:predicted  nucleic acid-binding Zn-ribbon protein
MGEPHPLLELQRLDLEADGLRARRAGLPERAAHAACEAELAALVGAQAEVEARRTALGREEHQAETVVADLGAKAREVEGRLYSGQVTAIKELEALQHELQEWRRRQGEQEEAELALMEQQEGVAGEIAGLDAHRKALEAERARLRQVIGAAEAEIDAELARILEARGAVLAQVPADVCKRYEALRAAPPIRGRAVARIQGGACSGCRATLPIAFASGLEREPAGTVAPCPRCGRLLVT